MADADLDDIRAQRLAAMQAQGGGGGGGGGAAQQQEQHQRQEVPQSFAWILPLLFSFQTYPPSEVVGALLQTKQWLETA